GRSVLIFRVGLVHSAVLWAGLGLLASRGIAWVALAVTAATLVSATVAFACATRVLRLSPAALGRAVFSPAVATAVMGGALAALRRLPLTAGAASLAVLVGAGLIVYGGVLALLAPADVREVLDALAALRERRRVDARALAADVK